MKDLDSTTHTIALNFMLKNKHFGLFFTLIASLSSASLLAQEKHVQPCQVLVEKEAKQNLVQLIETQSLEKNKLATAKQALEGKGLLASDVADLMLLFDFEQSKIEFAQWAYQHTCDKENYYQIKKSLDLESSYRAIEVFLEEQ